MPITEKTLHSRGTEYLVVTGADYLDMADHLGKQQIKPVNIKEVLEGALGILPTSTWERMDNGFFSLLMQRKIATRDLIASTADAVKFVPDGLDGLLPYIQGNLVDGRAQITKEQYEKLRGKEVSREELFVYGIDRPLKRGEASKHPFWMDGSREQGLLNRLLDFRYLRLGAARSKKGQMGVYLGNWHEGILVEALSIGPSEMEIRSTRLREDVKKMPNPLYMLAVISGSPRLRSFMET